MAYTSIDKIFRPSLRRWNAGIGLAGTCLMGAVLLGSMAGAQAQVPAQVFDSLGAPATLSTAFGQLEFKDGVPTAETAAKTYDLLTFSQALAVYNNSFRGASALAIVKGFEGIGAKPGLIRSGQGQTGRHGDAGLQRMAAQGQNIPPSCGGSCLGGRYGGKGESLCLAHIRGDLRQGGG